MKHTLLFWALSLISLFSFAQKRIVVMGSSTAAGTGSTTTDSSWVGRLQKFYRQNGADGQDTVVINIAWYGQTTYSQMPTGWVSPVANRPAVDPDHNVTKALSYAPDAVIINLPSNDVANFYWGPGTYDMKETMDNFRYMANVFAGSGVNTFFTTTQPRDDMDFTKRQMQRQLYDSIYNNFGQKVINFWDPIVTTDGQYMIKPELKYDDIHVNDWGHRLLFQQAAAKNLFSGGTAPQAPGPGRIEAESYSAMQGVQTESTSDAGGGLDVGYIDNGDWIDYRVNPSTSGVYTFNFRVASAQSGAQFQLRNAAGSVLATVAVPNTGGWQTWQTVSVTASLQAGTQTIRLASVAGAGWNINWLEYKEGGTTPPPPTTTTTGRIEAESYTLQSGTQLENTSDAGGGQNVGYIDNGDWMDYAVNPPASGTYTVNFRVATQQSDGQLQLRTSTGTVLATVAVPNTGGWQTWQTVSATVTLNTGPQTLRIVSTASSNWNLNWWELVQGSTTTPATTTSGRIEAEAFSSMSGVQTENTADAGGGLNVGYIDNGDWMDYSVNVNTAGAYTLSFRIATQQSGAQFAVRNASGSVLATVSVPNTGGWQSWQTVTATVNLAAGQQTIRLGSTASANWNINWLEVGSGTSASPSSLKIEAENYSTMAGVQTEGTSDAGGGQNVGYIDNGDWMDYSVNIPASGTYTVNFRVASQQSGGQLQLRTAGGTVLATVAVPNTGGWQTWQTVSATVTLSAGQQTLRIVSTAAANWNINWWEVVSSASALSTGAQDNSTASLDANIAALSVYPNPVVDRFVLQVNNNLAGVLKAQLYDMNGALQKEFSLNKNNTGAVQFYLSAGTLPAGTYVLKATMTNWNESTQVVKQ